MVSAVQPADMLGNDESQETLGLFLSSGGMTKQVAGVIKRREVCFIYCHEIKCP